MIPLPETDDSCFETLCGAEFANGMHRTVHHVVGHPELVMKVDSNTTFANWNEYLVSSALCGREEPVAQLIARVVTISATGKFLIMERLPDISQTLSGIQYPRWLTDLKPSTFGVAASGDVKVRDYGTLKLADILARYNPFASAESPQRIIHGGHDHEFEALRGRQIGVDGERAVHKVNDHPNHVLKVCSLSHRANRTELLIYSALQDMNAEEVTLFGNLECSRTGRFLIMERLTTLPTGFTGARPQAPWWLANCSDASFGLSSQGRVKIRSYGEFRFGDVLVGSPLGRFT